MAGLPSDAALLLDLARAEAKRRSHAQVTLLHVAAALQRRDAARFTSTFGQEAGAQLEAMLGQLPTEFATPSDAPELSGLMDKAVAEAADVMAALEGGIREALAGGAATGGATAPRGPLNKAAVLDGLRKRILGQEEALETIVSRLALTRMEFDLKPRRPDGVFLFAGPSGVGKTALALALAESLYGDAARLIRLDMSEYSHDWAVSRLIGPQPGYVGSDRPEGWLTTRVRNQPESLILLDEIEKSHPTVWNTFLQIFDDGRLTDGQGQQADFSRTVIVMTSNLGSEAFRRKAPIGFRTEAEVAEESGERTLEAVKEAMAPELVNRLDAIIVFDALSREVIRDIAGRDIATALERVRGHGYEVAVPSEVVTFVAESGYDPAYGARHLQRNIERLLLETLVEHPPSKLQAVRVGDHVEWRAD